MGRRAGISHNESRLREHLARALQAAVGTGRGGSAEIARKAGITRQALSLYLRMKATPGSETLRHICSALNLSLDIEGAIISASGIEIAAAGDTPDKLPEQMSLFRAIAAVDEHQLKVEVLNRGAHSMDLKVSIDFSDSQPRIQGTELPTSPDT